MNTVYRNGNTLIEGYYIKQEKTSLYFLKHNRANVCSSVSLRDLIKIVDYSNINLSIEILEQNADCAIVGVFKKNIFGKKKRVSIFHHRQGG